MPDAACEVCGDEKILMEDDGSNAQPCYACQPAGTTLEQASRLVEQLVDHNPKRYLVMLCAGCEQCEPSDGSEPSKSPCVDSPSSNGAKVVLAEEHDRIVEGLSSQLEYVRGVLGASSRNEMSFNEEAANYRHRSIELEKALSVARDDLFKAANQFAGLVPKGENQHIFAEKAKSADAALRVVG